MDALFIGFLYYKTSHSGNIVNVKKFIVSK